MNNNELRDIWFDALSESDPDYVEMMTDTFMKHE